ncbi:MAG: sugar phosphate isomerase/epimerase family protein [Victivallales bacterium]
MKKQNYEIKNGKIRDAFQALKAKKPERLKQRLNLSWSNWGFGIEPLSDSAARLQKAGVRFIELHGNHYGPGLGYKPSEASRILSDHGVSAVGVCGMFSRENDLSSPSGAVRQQALDYIRRELDFAREVGAGYLLVVPGAVGRPQPCDDAEFHRSTETLRIAGDWFVQSGIKAAIEPIRSSEVSLVHTFAEAEKYIQAVKHPGVAHINGDVYHMQTEEQHIGDALMAAGDRLVNLHMADSNRCALGLGSLDLDTIIMALYCIGFNASGRFVTPEPLGPGGDPYPAMHGQPDKKALDKMVQQTVSYFREREEELLSNE